MPRQKTSNFNLEQLLGKPLDEVDAIINDKSAHLHAMEIPKKDGTKRQIMAPGPALKYIQKSIYWRIFRRYKSHNAVHGFVQKRGIATNASPHVGALSIGKIDVSKFFDSISSNHLKNVLFGNKHICRYCTKYERMLAGGCDPSLYKNKATAFKYRCEEIKAVFIPDFCEEMAYESLFNRVIELCTVDGFCVQGFPTSPVIGNIVLKGFDKTMEAHCEENNVIYTRYADDLAFSSTVLTKDELKKLVKQKAYRHLWAYGFEPNKKKTTFKSKKGRLKICGVVVNEKMNIQKSVMHLFRAKVYNATVKHKDRTTKARIRQLRGYASFVMSINPTKGKKYMNQLIEFEKVKFPKKPEAAV